MKKWIPAVAMAVAMGGMALSAKAAVQLLDFKPVPITDSIPEITWNGSLSSAIGAQGNGLVAPGVYDGDLPITQQQPDGLQIGTPITLSGGRSPVATMTGTTYYDCSLILQGLAASGPAITFSGTIIQPLGAGTFMVTDTAGNNLLSGTIGDATITALAGTRAGSALSGSVSYTGGLIFQAIQGGAQDHSGTFSFALNSLTNISTSGTTLLPFDANAEGHFDIPAIPEPASISLLGLGAVSVLARRRRA